MEIKAAISIQVVRWQSTSAKITLTWTEDRSIDKIVTGTQAATLLAALGL